MPRAELDLLCGERLGGARLDGLWVAGGLDGLRAPWARQGIRLVTVAPGFVKTPMIAGVPQTPLAMEPEDAARVILDGLGRGQSVIRFPRLAALTMGALRLLPPGLLDRLYRG